MKSLLIAILIVISMVFLAFQKYYDQQVVIELQPENQISEQTTSVPADYIAYVNESYGYKIWHPAEMEISSQTPNDIDKHVRLTSEDGVIINITVLPNDNEQQIERIHQSAGLGCSNQAEVSKLSIQSLAGYSADYFTISNCSSSEDITSNYLLTENDSKFLVEASDFDGSNQEKINTILTTFRFID